jgi:mitochondrial fission protein ELM1
LIGGDGSGYRWSSGDGRRLGQLMRGLHELTGRTWLVTTSRRTPAEFETALRAELPASAVGDACWFHAGDQRRVVSAYLGGAAAVFVSEDSMSMIHEGITSGQRVVTLRPVAATPPASHQAYIEHAVEQRWIRSEPLVTGAPASLAQWLSAGGGYAGDALADMGRALLARLEQQGKLSC